MAYATINLPINMMPSQSEGLFGMPVGPITASSFTQTRITYTYQGGLTVTLDGSFAYRGAPSSEALDDGTLTGLHGRMNGTPILDYTGFDVPLYRFFLYASDYPYLIENMFLGSDTVIGSGGNDTLIGGQMNDSVVGGEGNDYIVGGYGSDIIYGNAGADLINGRHLLYQDAENDTIYGGQDNDTITGGNGGANVFYGNLGDDLMQSDAAGRTVFYGGQGNDVIHAGHNDTIIGNRGDDYITGSGANVFVFGGDSGHDTIAGVNAGETILLLGLDVAEISEQIGFTRVALSNGGTIDIVGSPAELVSSMIVHL